jgi:FkbM family methyltransferase
MLASTKPFDSRRAAPMLREIRRLVRSGLPLTVLNWREARFYAQYGEVELHLLDLLCRRDRDSIDVGANDGSYVHFLWRCSRVVHAFEPMPELAQTLRRKFPRCNVVIHQAALSREEGITELHMPLVDGVVVTGCSTISGDASAKYASHRSIAVPVHRLDNVFEGEAGFIKIDVEGHQQAVLDGALTTIRRDRPRMLVEVEDRLSPGGLAPARAFFEALSYQGFFVYDGKLRPVEEFSVPKMQDPANLPDLTAPLTERRRFGRYVYNFIFLPSEEARRICSAINERLAKL